MSTASWKSETCHSSFSFFLSQGRWLIVPRRNRGLFCLRASWEGMQKKSEERADYRGIKPPSVTAYCHCRKVSPKRSKQHKRERSLAPKISFVFDKQNFGGTSFQRELLLLHDQRWARPSSVNFFTIESKSGPDDLVIWDIKVEIKLGAWFIGSILAQHEWEMLKYKRRGKQAPWALNIRG